MSSLEVRVCGRYKLENKLFEGKKSSVYMGRNVQSDTDCAIKCQSIKFSPSFVKKQGKVLEDIQGGKGVPNLLWFGENGDFNFLITELLGNSLQDYLEICGGCFTLKTVLMIADKVLSNLQFIHSKNYLHRDMKPSNLLVGLGKKITQIYIIDYGFATNFYSFQTYLHNKDQLNEQNFIGTLEFASLNVLKGHKNSRRDDLESLGFILIYFLKGKLPWSNVQVQNIQKYKKNIQKVMSQTTIEQLCDGLPTEFYTYLRYARNLKFQQNPDYNYLKRLFKQKLIRDGFNNDHIYDWILIPLRLQDLQISSRIPLNRHPKIQADCVKTTNYDYNFEQEFKDIKKESTPENTRKNITKKQHQKNNKKNKVNDCPIY